jgi:hypothetical protein
LKLLEKAGISGYFSKKVNHAYCEMKRATNKNLKNSQDHLLREICDKKSDFEKAMLFACKVMRC